MLRFVIYILVFMSLLAGDPGSLRAEKRVALVIGNAAYEHVPALLNPRIDAQAISARLEELGFDVVTGFDLKQQDFARIFGEFKRKLEHAGVALFFYAGHGLQVNGRNYMAAVDARLDDEVSLSFEAVEIGTILGLMERRRRTSLVFLDACRDNPLTRNLGRSMGTRSSAIGQGLARVESGAGTLIAFATQPGNVALDGDHSHSPFSQGLIKHMATPGLDIALMMRRVRQDVIDATGGRQIPWHHSSLTASFSFSKKPHQASGPEALTGAGANAPDALAVELAFWQAAKDTGTREAYEAYKSKYPDGNFAPLAEIKLEEFAGADPNRNAARTASEAEGAEPGAGAAQGGLTDVYSRFRAAAVAVASSAASPREVSDGAEKNSPSSLILAIQQELERHGCKPGKADGRWGRRTRYAMRKFNRYSKLRLNTRKPAGASLPALRSATGKVCLDRRR